MLTDDTGWMRISPAEGGKLVYLKWKWTAGPLSNRYVMAVGAPNEWPLLLDLLEEKKRAAEEGRGPSAADHYHRR